MNFIGLFKSIALQNKLDIRDISEFLKDINQFQSYTVKKYVPLSPVSVKHDGIVLVVELSVGSSSCNPGTLKKSHQ